MLDDSADTTQSTPPRRSPFTDPQWTAEGARRAQVPFTKLRTLWVNTGTLCNIECATCYIKSSPTNDALTYLRADELAKFLHEAKDMGTAEIGFTGGEPFMNPDMIKMAQMSLELGFSILILTNAMAPMMRPAVQSGILGLRQQYQNRMSIRVSLDHYTAARHDLERGKGAFDKAMVGLSWLYQNGFQLAIAGRADASETDAEARAGYAQMLTSRGITLDTHNPNDLVIFPEMDETATTPEITEACWGILNKHPSSVMCADARMVVKRKGAARPVVLACTLVTEDQGFELGHTLHEATQGVSLNHPHCSRFCVLGGASCSA